MTNPVVPDPRVEPSRHATPFSSPAMEERDAGIDLFGIERGERHGERPLGTRGAWIAALALWALIIGGLFWMTGVL